jgi:hypothetical protein
MTRPREARRQLPPGLSCWPLERHSCRPGGTIAAFQQLIAHQLKVEVRHHATLAVGLAAGFSGSAGVRVVVPRAWRKGATTLNPAPTDSLRDGANLFFAATQSVLGQTSRITGHGIPVDQRPETFHAATPIAPAFAIWAPLFISEALYAWRVASGGGTALDRDIGWLTAAAFAGNSAWEVQAELRGFEWQSNAIILGAASAAVTAIIRAETGDYSEADKRRIRLPIGTLAGWLVLASAANAEASRIRMLGRPSPAREANEAIVLIAIASSAAASIAVATRGSGHFVAGAGWGLANIAVRNVREKRPHVAWAAVAGIGLALTGFAIGRRRAK